MSVLSHTNDIRIRFMGVEEILTAYDITLSYQVRLGTLEVKTFLTEPAHYKLLRALTRKGVIYPTVWVKGYEDAKEKWILLKQVQNIGFSTKIFGDKPASEAILTFKVRDIRIVK